MLFGVTVVTNLSLEDVRPAVLLLTLAPDSVFEETDRLLGMAVTMLESVVVVVVLLLLLSLFLAQAANIIAMLIIIHR